MSGIEPARSSKGEMVVRKELRMHREDEVLIELAASATGLPVTDFIRRAAILQAQEVQRRVSRSALPVETFDGFKAAVEASGKTVLGLARAFKASKSRLKHVDETADAPPL